MSDQPTLVGELISILEKVSPVTPVIFEIEENGDSGDTNWSIDEAVKRNGFLVLRSVD